MPRQPNAIETVNITLSTTPVVKQHLEMLVRSGLYGKSHAEAAERLIAHEIERLITIGTLKNARMLNRMRPKG